MSNSHFDEKLCAQCRGRCCQGHPGVWSEPSRFFSLFFPAGLPPAADLQTFLGQKRLILRNVGGVLIPAPQEHDQGCGFLQITGCSLATAERPCQCLALIPELETLLDDVIHCRLPAACGSGAARENWRPYQPLLKQVQRRVPCSFSCMTK